MKKILISADAHETRVAVVEDNVVVETMIERADGRSLLGNCYLGLVDNVLPGMEAAFIDAGLAKNAFLYVSDVQLPELEGRGRRDRRIETLLKNRQKVVVQVEKDPMGTKGARVTMELSFAGRFLVYAPGTDGHGVSKSLPDKERDRLRALVKGLKPRHRAGLIVRTAARGASLEELQRDLELLELQWEEIEARVKTAKAPSLVHAEADLALQMIRDELRVDVEEVLIDDEPTYERIRAYVEQHCPDFLERVRLHKQATPLMRRFQVEEAIRSTLDRRVDLPSGGYLLVDYAEAFTIIDVNTGRFVGKARLEDTILHNNLEAAREVARQLRLRDIGGIIVIDFVDMAAKKNRDAVMAALQKELEKDRAKVYVVSISPLGLVEMTRENVTDGVREILTEKCPQCSGEGRVLSDETLAIENLRHLRRHARLSSSEAFLVELNPDVAARMIGAGGKRLLGLEAETAKTFSFVGVEGAPRERCAVVKEGAVAAILEEALPVAVGQELELVVAEPHMFQAADAVHRLESGYPILVAGGGAYIGETHRVRIALVGRLEAHAELLTARPVTEEEMLALLDPRSDVQEPQRGLMERVDYEDRGRGRRTRKRGEKGADEKKAAAPAAAVTSAPASEEGGRDGEGAGKRRRSRRRRGGADEQAVAAPSEAEALEAADAELDEEEADEAPLAEAADAADGEDGDEAVAEGEGEERARGRRRRGRRGGRRRRREGGDGADGSGAGEGGDAPVELAEQPAAEVPGRRTRTSRRRAADAPVAVAEGEAPEAPAAEAGAAPEAAAPRPRRGRRTSAVATEAVVAEPAEPAAPAAAPAADAAEAPARPVRARRSRAAAPATADAPAVEAAPAETPAPAPRARRTRAAAAPAADAAAAPTAAAGDAEAAPAPRPRARRSAAASAAEAPAAAEPAATPAPRARRTRATATAAAADAPAAEAPAGDAPARPVRARRSRAAAPPEGDA